MAVAVTMFQLSLQLSIRPRTGSSGNLSAMEDTAKQSCGVMQVTRV